MKTFSLTYALLILLTTGCSLLTYRARVDEHLANLRAEIPKLTETPPCPRCGSLYTALACDSWICGACFHQFGNLNEYQP